MSSYDQTLPSHALPDWMRLAQRGVDWGFLLVLALCIIVSAPFALRDEIPHTNANENYIYETSNYAESIQEGRIYPRWSPNVLGGYGAPIPNFYPPAPAYSAALLQILLTNSPVDAVRLLYVLATCLGGLTVYMLVVRRSNAAAGILAAMLYVYSPYASLVVPHIQGDLTTMLVLALTPAFLWATDRLIRSRKPQNLLLVTLFTAGLVLTSPKATVAAIVLGLAYVIWYFRFIKIRRKVIQYSTAVGLGVLLASFYWIPALLEQSAIRWELMSTRELLTLRLIELITPLTNIDPAEMTHRPQLTLGLIGVLFTLGGTLTYIFFTRKMAFGAFFLVSGLAITILALTLLPHETWLLGFIVLCFSVTGSDILILRAKFSPRLRRLFLPILMISVWIGSRVSWLPPAANGAFGDTGGAAQINYEQQGFGTAVLPAGEAVPSSLVKGLGYSSTLIDSYKSGIVNKLAPGQLTGEFQASPLAHFTHGDQFQLRRVTVPVALNILTAYFPGWRAQIGSQNVNLQPNPNTGLIQIDLPNMASANSELSITLGSTNVRLGSWLTSGLALLIVIIWTWGKFRAKLKAPLEDLDLLKQDEARLIALPVGCFGLVALLLLIPNPYFNIVEPAYTGTRNSFTTQIRSNTGLTMTGFRLSNNVFSTRDDFNITLFWQAQRFLPNNYQVKLFLKSNSDLSVWNETALRNPGYYPTKRWNTQQYVSDRYEFPFEDGIAAGNYQIHIEAYGCTLTCDESSRLEFFNIDGAPLGADVILPTLITIHP